MSGTRPYSEFFDQLDTGKQLGFARRICNELIKGWGLQPAMGQFFRGTFSSTRTGDMTPEWLSDQVDCPILFRAVKDYQLECMFDPSKGVGVPAPLWLLDHRIDGPKTSKVWSRLWQDARELFVGHQFLATCFRVKWGAHTLALHNYDKVLMHSHSTEYPVRGGCLVWYTKQGPVILQYLRDLLSVLRADWQYEAS